METLTGTIDRITYHTEESGYSVLRVRVAGKREPVTVTGKLATVHEGEAIDAVGEWITAAGYGRQFKAESLTTTAPSSREGMEKFLGSGLIDGIGPVYAKKLVEKFGERIFEVIETESKRLQEVEGIGTKRRQEIKVSWEKQKSVRAIMVFLHQQGISTAKAVKIFQAYGENAVAQVKANPYKLAEDITGIGFRTADVIAQRLGLAREGRERLRAGIFHALLEAGDDGHCALPGSELEAKAATLLGVDAALVTEELGKMVEENYVVRESIDGQILIFPPHLANAEREIASRLKRLLAQPAAYPVMDLARALEWVEKHTGKKLAAGQQAAVSAALTNRVLIITGGPGVGKTTILNSLLQILTSKKVVPILAAPTGRAARRMSESTGHVAKTIHRLLEYEPGKGFVRNERSPLKGDLFVLDETSMVDVSLMAYYLRALPPEAHLLLVGDADQLPSVGPGNVLRDLMDSGLIPVARLTEIFRQASHSEIITAAHAINAGKMPNTETKSKDSDYFFIERLEPEDIAATVVHLASERMPAAFGLDPLKDIQVLCPMNRGLLGTQNLNLRLQEALNPPHELKMEMERYGATFRVGDKVIQIRNNYEKDVFNGDIGSVSSMEAQPLRVTVRFEDGRSADYETGDIDELRLAYAITIHKSQGSEFPAVIIPVSTQNYVMLQRNLLYTGLTRGRKRVVLVGDPKAVGIAVRNSGNARRWSGLVTRLG